MEKIIQNKLASRYWNKSLILIPNVYFFDWESDELIIDKDYFSHDFEIKNSLPDYRAEFKNKKVKHFRLAARSGNIPNYFWFVINIDFYHKINLPDYCGIIIFNNNGGLKLERNAPNLSKIKVTKRQIDKLIKSVYYKYWRNRIHEIK